MRMKTLNLLTLILLLTALFAGRTRAQIINATEIRLENTRIFTQSEGEDLVFDAPDDLVLLADDDISLGPRSGPRITVDVRNNRLGIGTNDPNAPLDVRGDNLILTRIGTTSSNLASSRFTALGESGGRQGAVNGCDIYGFRSQLSTSNFINVGVTSSNAPTISWETTNSSDRLDLRVDNSSTSCGTLVAQFGTGTYELVVYGSALASGGSWVTSDKRFKSNIKKIDNALGLVRQGCTTRCRLA